MTIFRNPFAYKIILVALIVRFSDESFWYWIFATFNICFWSSQRHASALSVLIICLQHVRFIYFPTVKKLLSQRCCLILKLLTISANQNITTIWIQTRTYKVNIVLYQSKYIIWKYHWIKFIFFLCFEDNLINDSIFTNWFYHLDCQKLVSHRAWSFYHKKQCSNDERRCKC